MEVVVTLFRRHAGEVIMPAFDKPDRLSPQVAALRLPASRGDSMSVETGACCGAGWLSFQRIAYIPFDACVAALEGLLREGSHGEFHVGQSRLRGPIKHDRRTGTCRVEVRLARGPLRPVLRMRLNIDYWSPPPSSTALELIPCGRVRASASYFRAGHLLMDSLIHSLQLEREMQPPDRVDEQAGQVFCLVEAPSAGAAAEVHRQAHGLVADHIYQVQEGS
jgi:Protein of unknown function (DUF4242)